MDLRHCDVCGSLVGGASPDEPSEPASDAEGLLCDTCLRTRRVLPLETAAGNGRGDPRHRANRFRCPHCGRKLRTKMVRARVEISCPKCSGGLVLLPGGVIEAVQKSSSASGSARIPVPEQEVEAEREAESARERERSREREAAAGPVAGSDIATPGGEQEQPEIPLASAGGSGSGSASLGPNVAARAAPGGSAAMAPVRLPPLTTDEGSLIASDAFEALAAADVIPFPQRRQG